MVVQYVLLGVAAINVSKHRNCRYIVKLHVVMSQPLVLVAADSSARSARGYVFCYISHCAVTAAVVVHVFCLACCCSDVEKYVSRSWIDRALEKYSATAVLPACHLRLGVRRVGHNRDV